MSATDSDGMDGPGVKVEKRHESLYFPDGNIVLSALKDEKTTWLFRVDKILMARYSTVFRDMLSLPLESDGVNEQYDGVPRVRLTDDAEPLSQLLGTMYNPATLPLERPSTDLTALSAVMRLAVKYDVPSVQLIIKRHVESQWTFELIDWERRMRPGQDGPTRWLGSTDRVYLNDLVPEPASAICFAVEFVCPNVFTRAMLDLSIIQKRSSWANKQSEPRRTHVYNVDMWRHARWELLETRVLLALDRGKESLEEQWQDFLLEELHPIAVDHANANACRNLCMAKIRSFMTKISLPRRRDLPDYLPDPLMQARDLLDEINNWNLCARCTFTCSQALQGWARKIWSDLPDIFSQTEILGKCTAE